MKPHLHKPAARLDDPPATIKLTPLDTEHGEAIIVTFVEFCHLYEQMGEKLKTLSELLTPWVKGVPTGAEPPK